MTAPTSNDGKTIRYNSVSILEMRGDKIMRFHAYFDSRALGQQLTEGDGQATAAVQGRRC